MSSRDKDQNTTSTRRGNEIPTTNNIMSHSIIGYEQATNNEGGEKANLPYRLIDMLEVHSTKFNATIRVSRGKDKLLNVRSTIYLLQGRNDEVCSTCPYYLSFVQISL